MNLQDKILITGAYGLVGTALVNQLTKEGYQNLVCVDRKMCDLTDFNAVKNLFQQEKPAFVFHLAATVFGLGGNLHKKGQIFLDNILINTHVIEACRLTHVKKIVAMGTIAAYPLPQAMPIKESSIWDGPPHASESSYGHAKRAMLAMLIAYQEDYDLDYAYVLSTNLYGPHDKFDSQYGHVIPSLIRKFYEAKKNTDFVTVWGDGSAARDFMYSKDAAKALIEMMHKLSGPINMATGHKSRIKDAVDILANYLNMQDKVIWDSQMPNGRDYNPLDISKLNSIGFKPSYSLEQGLIETYEWFSNNHEKNLTRS